MHEPGIDVVDSEEIIGNYRVNTGHAVDDGVGYVIVSFETEEYGRQNYAMTSDQARNIAMNMLELADIADGKASPNPAAN